MIGRCSVDEGRRVSNAARVFLFSLKIIVFFLHRVKAFSGIGIVSFCFCIRNLLSLNQAGSEMNRKKSQRKARGI